MCVFAFGYLQDFLFVQWIEYDMKNYGCVCVCVFSTYPVWVILSFLGFCFGVCYSFFECIIRNVGFDVTVFTLSAPQA